MTTLDPTCRTEGISKSFGRTHALRDVTLEIGRGVTGLLGPNGAGKTTLLSILATILAPDRGTVRILGLDPSRARQRTAIRRSLGYMPQEPGFHRNFTVVDFVDYVAILKEITGTSERRAEVSRVISAVGLDDKKREKIRSLSGGMRRRVAIAQALLANPALLILDEPTAGLDPEQRLRFRELISRLGEDRLVLLSTHQTEDVTALCGDVAVMHQGRVLATGTPHTIAEVAKGHVWLSAERADGSALAWRVSDGRYRHIGDAPAGAELIPPTLEDGYMLLVGREAAVPDRPARPDQGSPDPTAVGRQS